MSGEMGFLLALPLAIVAVPVILGGAVLAGAATVAGAAIDAAADYEKLRRAERDEIRSSGIKSEILDYRKSVKDVMNAQRVLNKQLSENFEEKLQKSRERFTSLISMMDTGEEAFAEEVKAASKELIQLIQTEQKKLQLDYQVKIEETLQNIAVESQKKHDHIMSDIDAVWKDMETKEAEKAQVALNYIDEVNDLIQALDKQFQGGKYVAEQLKLHCTEVSKLTDLYDKKQYDACLVAAASMMGKVRQDIFAADEKHQEFENWQKTAAILIAENKAMMSSQKVLTAELYEVLIKEAEKTGEELGITLDDVGTDLSVYWGRTKDGESVYGEMLKKLEELERCVLDENCQLSSKELQEICSKMSSEWRINIMQNSKRALERWNGALQREALALDIISRMEEHGYQYNDEYAYIRVDEHGDSVKVEDSEKNEQLCMKFVDGYGDEILVRLYDGGNNKVRLQITDMAEEIDPEIDKSHTRAAIEQEIHAIVEGEDYQGMAQGGCQKGTEHKVVVNPKNKKIHDMI